MHDERDIPRASKVIAYGCLVLVMAITTISIAIMAYGLWTGGS